MRNLHLITGVLCAIIFFSALIGCTEKKPLAEGERLDYIGCYTDDGDAGGAWGRDLDKFFYNSDNMTIDGCIQDCRALGYKYAGLQSQNQCFCGNSYGKYGAAEGRCTKRCAGNQETICGGTWANSIYETGATPE